MWEVVEQEVQAMAGLQVIKMLQSKWCSSMVLVLKPDRNLRFFIDFRRVNAISRFDAYPISWINKLLDWLGKV